MPPSIRAQAAAAKRRETRDNQIAKDRATAVQMLRSGAAVAEVVKLTPVKRTTADRIKQCIDKKDSEGLQKLLSPHENRAGRPAVLSPIENKMMRESMVKGAERGFAFSTQTALNLMADIASDGRDGYDGNIPSMAALRSWRARNRQVTLRKGENKDAAKLAAESYEHVKTFATALKSVAAANPGIFNDPDRLWNMDETEIDASNGKVTKVFGSSQTNRGGFRKSLKTGSGRHMTLVVAISASGRKAPPLFIIAGTNVMSSWFSNFTPEIFHYEDGSPHWLACPDWFPEDGVVVCTKNGSNEMAMMPIIIQHINKFVRKFVPTEVSYCLTLDGHASRNGSAWLVCSKDRNMEVVQSPANTSHKLQPCDQLVNKRVKDGIKTTFDELNTMGSVASCSTPVKLKLGIAGYHAITCSDVQQSFEKCGLWPMDFRFLEFFRDTETEDKENMLIDVQATASRSVAGRLPSVKRRACDRVVFDEIKGIVGTETSASEAIQHIATLLEQHKTVYSILSTPEARMEAASVRETPAKKRAVLQAGAPAAHLTIGELIKRRQDVEQKTKEDAEAKAAERARKASAKQAREREKAERAAKRKSKKRDSPSKVAPDSPDGGDGGLIVAAKAVEKSLGSTETGDGGSSNDSNAAETLMSLALQIPNSAPF